MAQVRRKRRTSVSAVMGDVEKSRHRIAVLVNMIGHLAAYENYNGQPPERMVEIDRVMKRVDREVLRELTRDICHAVRAERERLDSLLDASASVPVIDESREVFQC